jgi:acyl-CoA thioesterase
MKHINFKFYKNNKTKVGFNIIEVKKDEELVALFKDVVYRMNKDWE